MRGLNNKKGQQTMGLPFGMIFALILIVVFIVFAFIAIGGFLDIEPVIEVGLFYDELQAAVDDARSGQYTEADFKIDLPSGIEKVCFANLSARITPGKDADALDKYEVYDANVFLIPPQAAGNLEFKLIRYINITKITESKNPYCVSVDVDLRIKKGFYDRLVTIE